jgi:hypothetical protein
MKFPTLLAVLMASVSMTACVEEPMEDEVQTTQKDAYATLDQCLEDWGDKELCTKAMDASIAQQQADQASLPENVESQNHLVITDPLASIVCLDCAFPMSQVTINYPPTAFFKSPTPTATPKPVTP